MCHFIFSFSYTSNMKLERPAPVFHQIQTSCYTKSYSSTWVSLHFLLDSFGASNESFPVEKYRLETDPVFHKIQLPSLLIAIMASLKLETSKVFC